MTKEIYKIPWSIKKPTNMKKKRRNQLDQNTPYNNKTHNLTKKINLYIDIPNQINKPISKIKNHFKLKSNPTSTKKHR